MNAANDKGRRICSPIHLIQDATAWDYKREAEKTIAEPVEGVGHFEPLRHYAEVHLLLEPLPAGSGLVFDMQALLRQMRGSVHNQMTFWQGSDTGFISDCLRGQSNIYIFHLLKVNLP